MPQVGLDPQSRWRASQQLHLRLLQSAREARLLLAVTARRHREWMSLPSPKLLLRLWADWKVERSQSWSPVPMMVPSMSTLPLVTVMQGVVAAQRLAPPAGVLPLQAAPLGLSATSTMKLRISRRNQQLQRRACLTSRPTGSPRPCQPSSGCSRAFLGQRSKLTLNSPALHLLLYSKARRHLLGLCQTSTSREVQNWSSNQEQSLYLVQA
mmetsp:Transcript_55427/g.101588  ORF Transcript_55427/g.101588 Transcript_55427/m.101588 type:complete len:210 (+) Transcript_55427:365-994(+)